MEIYTRELKRELKNTETDRDLWKNRYIRRLMGDGTTIERAVIERDNWQHKYESLLDSQYLKFCMHLSFDFVIVNHGDS